MDGFHLRVVDVGVDYDFSSVPLLKDNNPFDDAGITKYFR